jgi:hypothetical protein
VQPAFRDRWVRQLRAAGGCGQQAMLR